MRYVSIDLSSDNHLHQPQYFAGYAGEHNETVLQVTLPSRMLNIECSGYRFDFQTSDDKKIQSPLIPICELEDNDLSFRLSEQLTVSGKLLFNVVALQYDEANVSLVAKTNIITLHIDDSPEGESVILDPNGHKEELEKMVDKRIQETVNVENLEEKEILTITEFNNIAVNTEVEGVKVSGGLFNTETEGLLRIGSNDTNYNSQIRNLVLNDGKSIFTLPKGRYQITYDFMVLSGEFKTYENASVVFGSCPRSSWIDTSWQNIVEGFSAIAPDVYNGIRYEDRNAALTELDGRPYDFVDFSCYKLNTWYSVKDTFEITEDNSIIVVAAKNMTNWVHIANIVISEISQKTSDSLLYTEVNKAPNSQSIWEGMSGFVNDTVSRTQQHSHWEIKALTNLLATTGKQVFHWSDIQGNGTINGLPVGGASLYHSELTDMSGSYLVLSPDRNTYEGEPKAFLFNQPKEDETGREVLSLPKGTYLVKYKWRQSGRTPQTFLNFDKYCNRMPYVKFVNQLDNQSTWTATTGVDISGNILKYRGNYWANQWYEDSYIFTIDDSNYGGYFGIKAAYLQGDVHIADVEIYSISKNCYDKKEVDIKFGDIDTALDEIIAEQETIIAIQNALIGGGNV